MSDPDAPIAAAEPQAGLPRVVVVVRPLSAGADVAPLAPPAAEPIPAPEPVSAPEPEPVSAPEPEPVSAPEPEPVSEPEPEPVSEPEPEPEFEPAPAHAPAVTHRGPADDRLVAAVVQIDLGASPSPLTDFLGKSLLYRAARVAYDVEAPRLILVGAVPDERRDEVFEIAYEGFCGGVVELTGHDPGAAYLGPGRVVLLDAAALHDPAAVARLARVGGGKTSILLGEHGDGLEVTTESGQITAMGSDMKDHDGVMVGACSVPVDDFELLTRIGGTSALRTLAENEQLVGTVASETYGRQFGSEERLEKAEEECFDALAASGNEGLFEDLIGRPFSKMITLKLLTSSVSPGAISVVAGVLAMLAAGLLALGHAGAAVGAAFLAIVSAILDRADGELARLRLDEDQDQRSLDFGLDHFTHAILFLGLAYGVEHPASGVGGWPETLSRLPQGLRGILEQYSVSALTLGLFAAGGVLLLLAILLWRGLPSPHSRGLRRLGDAVATSFGSRDYFYLLLLAAVFNAIPGLSVHGVLGFFLLLTTVLVYASFALLLLTSVAAPSPHEA